jgi:hypothetical protein
MDQKILKDIYNSSKKWLEFNTNTDINKYSNKMQELEKIIAPILLKK